MGNERVASVKLTLNGQSFVASLKAIGVEGEKAAKKVESSFKTSAVAGLKSMGRAASEMGATVKSTIGMVAGLGGAMSLAEGVKGAINLRSELKNIAFAIHAGTGEAANWQDLMRTAQQEAKTWGQNSEELGQSFKRMFQETGDAQFAQAAMGEVAKKARATGESIDTLTEIAGKMNDKFGITAKELPDALTAAFSLANQGGIKFDEMGERLGLIGASAKLAGIQGVDGFQKIVGMANIAKASSGTLKKALSGVTGLLDQMGTPEHAKKIGAVFGVATKDAKGMQKDTTKILGEIFAKTHGKKESLARGFEGEQLKVVNDLGQVFRSTFESTTGTVEQKTKAALKAYEETLSKAGRSAIDNAEMDRRAKEKMETPQAQMAVAMERLKEAFTSPEMMNGLMRLAKVAPEAANRLANLLTMAFEHPAVAAGIFAGIKLGVPFIKGAMAAGAESFAKVALKTISGGGGGGAIGSLGGLGGAKGAMGVLGRVTAVAGAAALGYEAGSLFTEHVVDPVANKSRDVTHSLQDATMATEMNTSGKFTKEGAESSLATLRARLDEAKKDKEFGWDDIKTLGLRRVSTASDKDIDQGEATYAKGKEALDKSLAPAAEKVAGQLDKAGNAIEKFAQKLDAVGSPGGGGTGAVRGPMPRGPVTPGYVPRG